MCSSALCTLSIKWYFIYPDLEPFLDLVFVYMLCRCVEIHQTKQIQKSFPDPKIAQVARTSGKIEPKSKISKTHSISPFL